MRCKQCGAEFEGQFCSACGAKAETQSFTAPSIPEQRSVSVKRKKPFYLRWWFILLVVIAIGVAVVALKRDGEEIIWEDIVLSEKIPAPPSGRGEIYDNSLLSLHINAFDVSNKQFVDYIKQCSQVGFTIDEETTSLSYEAFNAEGYSLSVVYDDYSDEVSIWLDAPIEMSEIQWPNTEAGKVIPRPLSTVGSFSYQYDDHFLVIVGNTPKAAYEEYVAECVEKGFIVDTNKGDDYYYAYNGEGWHLTVSYEGFNTIEISITAPREESSITTTTATTGESTTSDSVGADNGVIRSDFKAAMDSYEEFMDEYVVFMKKYADNPNDLGLLMDYAEYMSDYAEMCEEFEKWDSEDMNDAELAYYLEVQTRVNKKLLEVVE